MHATSFCALRHPCGMDANTDMDTDVAHTQFPVILYTVPSSRFSALSQFPVPSSLFPVPCSFNPVRNRNRNPTQRTYNLSASNGNQTVAGRVSERGREGATERARESARGRATTITMPAIPIRIKILPLRMRMCQASNGGGE